MVATSSLPGKAVEASAKEAEAVPVVLRGVLPSRAHPQLGCSAAPFPAAALVVRGSGRRDHILLGVRGITAIARSIIHVLERTLRGYSAHPIRRLQVRFLFYLITVFLIFPPFPPFFFVAFFHFLLLPGGLSGACRSSTVLALLLHLCTSFSS